MSITLTEENIPVFLRYSGGMVDAIIRASSYEAFEAAALSVRILVQEDDGTIRPGNGVDIDHIGPVVLTPGEYDEAGNEIVAPVMDTRHHVNVRLTGFALDDVDEETGMLRWHLWGIAWSRDGVPDPSPNSAEEARVLYDVALIDPDTISSPVRVWL